MEYRKASMQDVPRLCELRQRQLADEGQVIDKEIAINLRYFFENGMQDGSVSMWVAAGESRNAIIATAGLCHWKMPPSFEKPRGALCYIHSVFTLPEYRGQGIAGRLVQFCLEESRSLGSEMVFLHASEAGKAVYARQGFLPDDKFMTYQPCGEF